MSAPFRFPSARQRAAMLASPSLALPSSVGPVPSGGPAADSASSSVAAGDEIFLELPHGVFDRPGLRPPGNVDVVGEDHQLRPLNEPADDREPVCTAGSHLSAASSSAAIGEAIQAVMIERMKHFRNDHDLAADVAAIADNPRRLSRKAERYLVHALEDLQFRTPGYRARAKRHIARSAAMLLAFYDAVDASEEPNPEETDAL